MSLLLLLWLLAGGSNRAGDEDSFSGVEGEDSLA